MDWVTTIDTKAACPISTPPDPARLAGRAGLPCPYPGPIMPDGRGLRIAAIDPPEYDDLPRRDDRKYTPAEGERLRNALDCQYAELIRLRRWSNTLEAETAALDDRARAQAAEMEQLRARVAELEALPEGWEDTKREALADAARLDDDCDCGSLGRAGCGWIEHLIDVVERRRHWPETKPPGLVEGPGGAGHEPASGGVPVRGC